MLREVDVSESSSALRELIRGRIAAQDGISFAEFMELCLYHPNFGYYMKSRQRIGRQGDFFTSSSVHSLFGRLLGRQLAEMWFLLGNEHFVVVEQGAGEGHLALDVLDAIAEEAPQFYQSMQYVLVEISPDNRRRQAEVLRRHAARISWQRLDELQGISGCLLSNELIDAFPVQLGVWQADGPHELLVRERDGSFVLDPRKVVDETMVEHFRWLGVTPGPGCRFEINRAALDWVAQLSSVLRRGFVMTVDYGYPAQELYAAWRQDGTLRAYHRHQVCDDPFQLLGEQDLTAHVDFTALQRAAGEFGLETLYFAEQNRFLLALGFVEALCTLQEQEPDAKRAQALRLTLKNLILPDAGMGEVFKVLILGKGVGQPKLACSRRIKDLPLPGI